MKISEIVIVRNTVMKSANLGVFVALGKITSASKVGFSKPAYHAPRTELLNLDPSGAKSCSDHGRSFVASASSDKAATSCIQ